MRRPNKYGARRTPCAQGHTHASKLEARRCGELHLLQKAGAIERLISQPRYELRVNDELICWYVADFEYAHAGWDEFVTEDCKGVRTAAYRIKAKLFAALYGREVVEVRG